MHEHLIEVPKPLPQGKSGILIQGDLETLAEQLTDKERNALLIQLFRQNTEIIKFTREFSKVMDGMSNMFNGPVMPPGLASILQNGAR